MKSLKEVRNRDKILHKDIKDIQNFDWFFILYTFISGFKSSRKKLRLWKSQKDFFFSQNLRVYFFTMPGRYLITKKFFVYFSIDLG